MDKGRFLIETHLRTGRPVTELAAAHGVSQSWLFKLLRRYRLEGPERARAPLAAAQDDRRHASPTSTRTRSCGSERSWSTPASTPGPRRSTSTWPTPGRQVPSVSTIYRVLVARGFVTPEPHKRPKSSWIRFVAEFPNECWQADVTHVEVADGVVYEVLNVIDDHSRLCVASRAFVTTRSPDVVRTLHKAAETWGYPQRFLTDNGRIFTTPVGAGLGAMEAELFALGIATNTRGPTIPRPAARSNASTRRSRSSSPSKNRPRTKKLLQGQLDRFVDLLQRRPTASQPRATHAHSRPGGPREGRSDRPAHRGGGLSGPPRQGGRGGSVTLRHKGKLHHIGVGCPYAGWRVILLVDGLDVRILGLDGSPLRHLTLDPTSTTSGSLEATTGQLYDVSTTSSPMSRDITKHPQRDSNPCCRRERAVS